jgi:AsmA protein
MRLRTVLIAAGAVLGVAVAAAGVFVATFDANAYKPRIIAAAEAATGRTLRLSGPIRIKPALRPTLSVADVGLANAPWGSRPEMATLHSMDVQVALLPLLSGEIRVARVVLVAPDILLERNKEGEANWQFARPAQAATPAPAPAAAPAPAPQASEPARQRLLVDAISITGGRVALQDALLNRHQSVDLAKVEARATGAEGLLRLEAEAVWNALPFTATIQGGPVARLLTPGASGPAWPIDLTLASTLGRLSAKGSLAQPSTGAGFDLAISGEAADLTRFAPLAPDLPIPPLRNVAFAVQAADRGGALPELRALSLKLGESDLSQYRDGLVLRRLEVAGTAADQPLTLVVQASLAGVALGVEGETGPLAALLPGAPAAPWPIRLAATAGSARASITGALARPAQFGGLDARVQATLPDLAALSPLAGQPLPAIKDGHFQAHLRERGQGGGVIAEAIEFSAQGSDLSGNATLVIGARNRIEANLTSRRIDADALLAAMPAPPAPAPAAAAPPGAGPARPAPAAARAATRLIPDTPLPLDALRLIDARVQWAVAALRLGGADYTALNARVALDRGTLALRDLRATLPAGALAGQADIDARHDVPPVSLVLRAPGLELAELARAMGRDETLRGRLQVDVNVQGRGASPAAIAGTLGGHVGLAVAGAVIDNRLIDLAAGDLLRVLMPGMPREGSSNVTCIAVRFDATAGHAHARALLFDSNLAKVSGGGSINLGTEALALRLAPTLKLAQGGVSVPVDVGGTLLRPSFRPDALGALGQLGMGAILGGVLGATQSGRAEANDHDCPAALALARGGAPAPAGSAPPAAAPRPAPAPATIPGLPQPRNPFRN